MVRISDSTVAKTGRSMKKCENCIAVFHPPDGQSVGRSLYGAGHGADDSSGTNRWVRYTGNHHTVIASQTVCDDPKRAVNRSERYRNEDAPVGLGHQYASGRHQLSACAPRKVSGVYYVSVPPCPPGSAAEEGAIMFVDPRPRAHMNRVPNQTTEITVMPQPGMLIIFPSYYEHAVIPFRGPGVRVCIAFNANV